MDRLHSNDDSGKVIAFPFAARSSFVRKAAAAVAERHGQEANAYWRQMIADMRAQMAANGIREDAIEGELRAFSASVFTEIGERYS